MKDRFELYDVIRDTDANINGIVLTIYDTHSGFTCLWSNGVIGFCDFSDESLVPTGVSIRDHFETLLSDVSKIEI